jgi:hypothetical protein
VALIEREVVDKIEILEDGVIQVRKAVCIIKDGLEIAKTFSRHCVSPGDDYSNEDVKVRLAAQVFHDTETVNAYRSKQTKLESKK